MTKVVLTGFSNVIPVAGHYRALNLNYERQYLQHIHGVVVVNSIIMNYTLRGATNEPCFIGFKIV